MRIKKKIRSYLKRKIFEKNASCGQGLVVGPISNCMREYDGKISIGDNCEINGVLYAYGNGEISIGNNTFVNTSTFIGAMDRVIIGSHVIFATNVKVYDNNNHPTNSEKRREMCESGFHNELWEWKYADHKPIVIEDNVWIGEYSTILKGVTIGRGSIVASHSVVVKDVPPYSIVAGNPGVIVKKIKGEMISEKN